MADQGTEGLLSPWLRSVRIKAAIPHLQGKILDYGCGSGSLAEHVEAEPYLGVEMDTVSLGLARTRFPSHSFSSDLPENIRNFDTIVSLAVIEHVDDPLEFLRNLSKYLIDSNNAKIVITTPYPAVRLAHYLGAVVGVFSKHGNKEHQDLLNKNKLRTFGDLAGLTPIYYQRFLFSADQIAVFKKEVL